MAASPTPTTSPPVPPAAAAGTKNAAPASRLGSLLRSLSSRNLRLFFAGQGISMVGNWLTVFATQWLVYDLTHSAAALGLVGFAGKIPSFLLAPLGGALVDRWNLHRTMVVTQTLAMLQSAALAVITFTHLASLPLLLVLSIFQGLISAVEIPARQSFFIRMVDRREDLPNAIALNSSMVNVARLLGPAVAGVLTGLFGTAWCFTLDSASYLAVIAALLAMRLPARPAPAHKQRLLRDLRDGADYVWGSVPIRSILILLAMVSFVGVPYTVLMPVFAREQLHGGALLMGVMMAAMGVGALAGALRLAARKTVLGLGRQMPYITAGFGLGLIGFALSHWVWLSLPLLTVTGFCMVTQLASGNTLLQTIAEDSKRGRVMSFFTMAFQGMLPLGSLMVGTLATPNRLGPTGTIVLCGVGCLLGALWFARQLPAVRAAMTPIYVERGILPPIAAGLQQEAATAAQE